MLSLLVALVWLVPSAFAGEVAATGGAAAQPVAPASQEAKQEQVLTWTGNNSLNEYGEAPETATAGAATLVFENSVATGNTSGMTHTLTFDTSTPGYNHDVDVDITASPFDANGGRHEVQVNLSPGKYRFFCAIPGHQQMQGVLTVTEGGGEEDTTAPTVTAEVTGDQDTEGNYLGSATVSVSAEDTESGVAGIEYAVGEGDFQPYSEPVTLAEPGDYTVQYRATDNAGNTSDPGSVSFTVAEGEPEDDTPPEVTAELTGNQDADGNYLGAATVILNAQDAGSGVAGIEYDLDGAGFADYSEPVRVTELGEHTVGYRATDNAGNVSEAGSVSFTVIEGSQDDTTPPHVMAEVAGQQDGDGNYVGSATVSLTAHDDGSGVDTVEYSLDGGMYTPYTEPVVVSAIGSHTVEYRATDVAGNTSEPGSVSFAVVEGEPDGTAPTVTAEVTGEQDDEGNYLAAATVVISAEDTESGVATVEYALGDGDFTGYTDPVEVTEPGEHTVRYRATDNAGNVSETGSVTFTVIEGSQEDTTAPETSIRITGEQDWEWSYIDLAKITLLAEDDESGVALIEYSFGEGSFRPYRIPLTVLDPGEYTVHYRATDNAGNTSEVGTARFRIVADGARCTVSDARDTVVVGDTDTGVANVDTGNGCTINDLIEEEAGYPDHAAFVSHVRQVARDLEAQGVITAQERQAIVSAARGTPIPAAAA
ncbi:Ig-like domain repeat protein [Saccharomonospora sp. NPDC006951]